MWKAGGIFKPGADHLICGEMADKARRQLVADERWTLEDSFSTVCADLLSEQRFEPFVRKLFALPSGAWHTVARLCGGLPELPTQATELFAQHSHSLLVSYLPWPGSDEYALVIFLDSSEMWSTIATYNRQLLERRR
jgi:hypothetical protein